jgi:3-deoxy-D-manno-octulosonate 8-phosphate phosphatase (KDO 8-P phosphatase)
VSAPPTIQLLALDVDGVLTDGSILLDADGREIKRYYAADGVALRTWTRLGLQAAVITGRTSTSLLHRLAELGVPHVIQGSKDKAESLRKLTAATGVQPANMAFLGDDWPDLPVLRRVGYPIAVADAAEQVKALARFITPRRGGRGAVRDAVEHLLSHLGLMERALSLYDQP